MLKIYLLISRARGNYIKMIKLLIFKNYFFQIGRNLCLPLPHIG